MCRRQNAAGSSKAGSRVVLVYRILTRSTSPTEPQQGITGEISGRSRLSRAAGCEIDNPRRERGRRPANSEVHLNRTDDERFVIMAFVDQGNRILDGERLSRPESREFDQSRCSSLSRTKRIALSTAMSTECLPGGDSERSGRKSVRSDPRSFGKRPGDATRSAAGQG